jgi:anti-anti-sigma factor
MEFQINNNGPEMDIFLKGKFTFNDHKQFQGIVESINVNEVSKVTVNVEKVEFIDSSALGLLLLLKDKIKKDQTQLVIKSPKNQVKKMLELSKFYDMFIILD